MMDSLSDRVFRLLCVSQLPLNDGELRAMLAHLGIDGLSDDAVRRALSELVKQQRVTSIGRGLHRVHADVSSEAEIRRAIVDGTYPAYGEASSAVRPRAKWTYWTDEAQHLLRRDIRLSLYQGDDEWTQVQSYVQLPVVLSWFTAPVDPVLFRALSPSGRRFVEGQALAHEVLTGAETPFATDYALGRLRTAPDNELRAIHAHIGLWAGQTELVADAVQRMTEPVEAALAGALLALYQGDPKSSSKAFASAYRELGKTAKRKIELFFMPLAFLLDGGKTRAKQAAGLIGSVDPWETEPHAAWLQLPRLVAGDVPEMMPKALHPLGVLLGGLPLWWSGMELPEGMREKACASAEARGWRGVARALAAGPDGDGLIRLAPVRQEWERRLDKLQAIIGTAAPAAAEQVPTKRIVWEIAVHYGDLSLVPRQQTYKGSSWSKGRRVALTSLTPTLEGMTSVDTAIAACARPAGGSYGGNYVDWSPAVWSALADHPHIVDDEGEPITIVKGAPRLVVREVKGGTEVRVEPPTKGRRIEVVRVGAGYEVTVFSEEQRKVAELVGEGLWVPPQGRGAITELLRASEGLFEQTSSADRGRVSPVDPVVVVHLVPSGGGVLARLVVQPNGPQGLLLDAGVGSEVVLASVDGRPQRLVRDLAAESAAADVLLDLPGLLQAEPEGDNWRLPTPEACLELLEALRERDVPVFWPEEATLRFRDRLTAERVSVSVRSAGEWFEAQGEVRFDDETVLSLKELLAAVLDSKGRFVQLKDGSWIALTQQLRRQLDALARTSEPQKESVRIHPLASETLANLVAEGGATADRAFAAYVERTKTLPPEVSVSSGLKARLRPYQRDAYQWLARLAHLGVGGILADDMGLGKTLTSIALLLHRRAGGPALVVAPTSVGGNWVRELHRFAPDLRVLRLREASNRAACIAEADAGSVLITSYGLLLSEQEALSTRTWHTVVFDESQALKNPNTQRHKAAAELKADMRLALTGTPIENHSGELHAQVSVVNPGLLGSLRQFRRNFQRPIEQGDRSVQRQLRALVSPYLLRRTKSQVLDELPPRTDVDLPVQLSEHERGLYEAQRQLALENMSREDKTGSAVAVLAQLNRLRLLSCSPSLVLPDEAVVSSKMRVFGKLAETLVAEGHRALVFSQFVKHLTLLRGYLDQLGYRYEYLDGSTAARQRDRAVADFQQGDAPFFLISTRAGGQGLNLTGADYVIHMDPWWNPAVEDQASDRAHRMGQRRPVTVYRLYAQDTVEERILELHRTKRELADGLLAGTDVGTALDATQMLELMRR